MQYADAVRSRRSILGPVRPTKARQEIPSRGILDRPIPRKIFVSNRGAEEWALKHADESCHFHQRWEVDCVGAKLYAIGIYSVNSGEFSHWAE